MSKKNKKISSKVEPHENPLVAISDDENLPVLSNPALHRYLQEISQYELLSREETEKLAIFNHLKRALDQIAKELGGEKEGTDE